jgi:hypothetical protein
MPYEIKRVEYFNLLVKDTPGDAFGLLTVLADLGVSLLAFTGVPEGSHLRLQLFPEDPAVLTAASEKAGIDLDGPHPALLARGDDRLGALAKIHEQLASGDVDVFAASGLTDGRGSYGYVIYVRPEHIDRAVAVLASVSTR